MVTARQAALVQESWGKVRPIAPQAALLFYGRLFELDPSLRRLFSEDMTEQREKLMKTLDAAVNGLGNLGQLAPVLEGLGQRHVAYGVLPEHYPTVGAALLWTLEKGLGPDFTPEVKEAWTAVYGVVSQVMLRGADEG